MKLLLILVGYYCEENDIKYNYAINCEFEETLLTLELLKLYFINNDYNLSSFQYINFFCENVNLKKSSIILSDDKIKRIHIFTANNEAKQELITFFETKGIKISLIKFPSF